MKGEDWLILLLFLTPGYLLSVHFFWQFPHFQNPTFMQYIEFVDQSSPWFYWGLPLPFAFVGLVFTGIMTRGQYTFTQTYRRYEDERDKLLAEANKYRKEARWLEVQMEMAKNQQPEEKS